MRIRRTVSSPLILLAFLLAGSPASPAPANRTLVGQVVSVDAAAGTLVLRETVKSTPAPKSVGAPQGGKDARPAETVTVRIEATTQLLRGKKPVPVADLKPGDHAVVRYAPREPVGTALTVRVADVVVRPVPAPAASSPAVASSPSAAAYPPSDIPSN